jgi:hypothetical protein
MTATDPHQLRIEDLPTPFTADEIRDACRPGRQLRLRIEQSGEEPMIRVSRYLEGDGQTAVQESWNESPSGEPLSEPTESRESWLELQDHASFPRASTEVAEETLEIPAGRFDCLRYTQTVEDGLRRFWFARALPGQPIRWEISAGGQVVLSVTCQENTAAPTPAGT